MDQRGRGNGQRSMSSDDEDRQVPYASRASEDSQRGEESEGESFRRFYEAMYRDAYRFTQRILGPTGDPADAEDIAQRAFTKMWNVWNDPKRGIKNPRAYLLVTTRHEAIDYFRERRGARKHPSISLADEQPDTLMASILENIEISDSTLELVRESLESLTARERQVVILRYFYDLGTNEIASSMGISFNTVKYYLKSSRAKMREVLRARTSEDK